MLESVGKLSSIGEMLTIKCAASSPPGELQTSCWNSLLSSFHFGGTVHDIPCRLHFASWPPANACVCASVGFAFSALPLELDEDFSEPEPPEFLNFVPRLHNDNAKPSTRMVGICFMGHTHKKKTGIAVSFLLQNRPLSQCFYWDRGRAGSPTDVVQSVGVLDSPAMSA